MKESSRFQKQSESNRVLKGIDLHNPSGVPLPICVLGDLNW